VGAECVVVVVVRDADCHADDVDRLRRLKQ
jgi:hypothetical protein